MLESLALRIINLSEAQLTVLGILLTVAGFVFGVWFRKGGTYSLRRLPYFLLWSALFCAISALPFAWLLSLVAAQNGALWILISSVFLAVLVIGFANGVLAHARSVSAYRDGSGAWMGTVPFANLVLFFKRPSIWEKATWGGRVVGLVGVLLGLFLVASGNALTKIAEREMEAMALKAENDPEMQASSTVAMISGLGLEETLRQMAAEVGRQQVDNVTVLQRVESNGTELRYIYEVNADVDGLPFSTRMGLVKRNCSYEPLRPIIEAGASIKHVFLRVDGSEIGNVVVSRQLCGY